MCDACHTANGRAILADEGRPHVDIDAPTLTYADVFPGRVNPLDNDVYRRAYLELRASEPYSFTVPARRAA